MKQAITICLVHQKGGVGKSTVAVNIASELSKIYKTLLIDCDPMASCLDFGNARSEQLGEMNSLSVCQKSFTLRDGSEMSGKAIRQELKSFKNDYEILVIDSPGKSGVLGKAVASVSDLVIVPVVPGYFDLWAIEGTLNSLDEVMAVNDNLIVKILMNRRDDRTNLSKDVVRFLKDKDMTLMQTTLGSRTLYGQSAAGMSVVELDRHSEAAKEITGLLKEIESILHLGE